MEQILTNSDDTICAIATPAGRGGIATIRISGHDAIAIAAKAWSGQDLTTISPRLLTFGTLIDQDRQPVDSGLAAVMRAPHSFTGEDTVEISLHGSPAVMADAMRCLCLLGARPASPGEFTQRAFLNRKIDLAQAEGIADLIDATSRAARRLAQQQTSGTFSTRLDEIRQSLIDFASMLELELDFSEEDVEFADRTRLTELAEKTAKQTRCLAQSFETGQIFKNGIPVVIAGRPNAGKSTLLNALLHDDKAIVTDIPGTTRDIIEDTRQIGDLLFRFADTAGLRSTDDTVERIGVDRALARLAKASIVIWMIDPTDEIQDQFELLLHTCSGLTADTTLLTVINKADKAEADKLHIARESARHTVRTLSCETDIITISCKNEKDIENIENKLTSSSLRHHNPDNDLIITNERHRDALIRTSESLYRAITALSEGIPTDIVTQDIREAIHHLSTITGAITTDTLLHNIFSRFCIGK